MSEIATPSTVVVSEASFGGGSSTSDIASKIIADSDAADVVAADDAADVPAEGSTEEAATESVADADADPVVDPEVKAEVVAPPAQTEADKLLEEAGFKSKRADGRENRIPHSAVRKIIDNQLAKERAAFEPQQAATTEKLTAYEARIKEVDDINEIMSNDPERFIGMLSQLPGYATLLNPAKESAKPAPEVDPNSDMPQPDRQFADGSLTYSHEQHQKLLDWRDKQTEQRLLKRLEPIMKDYETEQAIRQNIPIVRGKMEEAAKWTGFNENAEEILAALKGNKRLTLEGAYQKVVLPKLQARLDAVDATVKETRAAARAEMLAELKAAPKSTAVQATTAAAATSTRPKTTQQIAADIIRNSK